MVSLFPDPVSVKKGVVEYIVTPENIGFVAIGCVLLFIAFMLGWITKAIAPHTPTRSPPALVDTVVEPPARGVNPHRGLDPIGIVEVRNSPNRVRYVI